MINVLSVSIVLCLCFSSTSSWSQETVLSDGLIARGEYLANIAGCKSCHTVENGSAFAGGKATETGFGLFYSPNITSDKTHGIGQWSLTDFEQALTQGMRPDGEHYYPVFPYVSYQNLTQKDIESLYYYLLTTKPSKTPSKDHDIAFPYSMRSVLSLWKWLYMAEGKIPVKEGNAIDTGSYLMYAVVHCHECHSPRTVLGGVVFNDRLNGGEYNDTQSYAPSLLPSRGGLKGWREDDLETYLLLGETPKGDYVGGPMVDVIDHVTNYLTNEDLRQLTEFILAQ